MDSTTITATATATAAGWAVTVVVEEGGGRASPACAVVDTPTTDRTSGRPFR